MASKVCIVVECGRKMSDLSRSDICSRCRSGFYYWGKRLAKIPTRRSQLRMLQSRFDFMPKIKPKSK